MHFDSVKLTWQWNDDDDVMDPIVARWEGSMEG